MFVLNDRQRVLLRNKLSEARFLIGDEIPVVSSMLFCHVSERLFEEYLGVLIQHTLVVFQYLSVATFISSSQLKEFRCTVLPHPLKVFLV